MAKRTLRKQLEPGLNSLFSSLKEFKIRDGKMTVGIKRLLAPMKRSTIALIPPPGYPGDDPDLKPLRKTVAIRSQTLMMDATWYGIIGPSYPSGAHGHLVEYGTRPHETPNAFDTGETIQHPGAKARLFMTRAYAKHKQQIESDLAELIGKEVTFNFQKAKT